MSTPANFNGQRPAIDANDAVMLLIDHQSGLFQTVGDMPMPELRARAAALAKIATLCNMPVITTACSAAKGFALVCVTFCTRYHHAQECKKGCN